MNAAMPESRWSSITEMFQFRYHWVSSSDLYGQEPAGRFRLDSSLPCVLHAWLCFKQLTLHNKIRSILTHMLHVTGLATDTFYWDQAPAPLQQECFAAIQHSPKGSWKNPRHVAQEWGPARAPMTPFLVWESNRKWSSFFFFAFICITA